jgi:hypothetical protein
VPILLRCLPAGQHGEMAGRLDLGDDPRCPFCSGPLEQGFVTARIGRIRWVNKPPGLLRYIGGASLATNWFVPPLLEAARCAACGVGLFGYDPDVYG